MSNIDKSKLLNVPHLGGKTITKRNLSKTLAFLVKNFLNAGGTINRVPPGVAFAAGFSRNQHPRNK